MRRTSCRPVTLLTAATSHNDIASTGFGDPICAVARRWGFTDASNFARMFGGRSACRRASGVISAAGELTDRRQRTRRGAS